MPVPGSPVEASKGEAAELALGIYLGSEGLDRPEWSLSSSGTRGVG